MEKHFVPVSDFKQVVNELLQVKKNYEEVSIKLDTLSKIINKQLVKSELGAVVKMQEIQE
jgi:23S rRNA C2498 (ribose-2'-O)-methylase RlmM